MFFRRTISDLSRLRKRMLEEKTQHFSRCVRSSRVSIGACGASSRPCVSSAVDAPVLDDMTPAGVAMDGASIGVASSDPSAMHVAFRARRSDRLLNYLIAIVGVNCTVAIAVKNNGRDNWPVR